MTEIEARCRTCRHLDPAYLKVYTGNHAFCKDPAKASVPDYIVLHRGRALFIEFKRRGKRPTPNQMDELRQIHEQAFLIFVIDDVPVGKFILELVLL